VRRVLVVSHTTGYQLRAFNDAAEQLGIELVFATDRCHRLDDPWQDRAVAVRFHEIDASVAAIAARARQTPVDGVIAVGDRPVFLAARAAETLGIRWHSVEGALASTDKRRSRTLLAAAGLPSPRFEVLDASSASASAASASAASAPDLGPGTSDSGPGTSDAGLGTSDLGPGTSDAGPGTSDAGPGTSDPGPGTSDAGPGTSDARLGTSDARPGTSDAGPRPPDVGFPCVLKPVGLSGSRGVIRAGDRREFETAYARIRALLARPEIRAVRAGLEDEILVEEYIDGREFALEGVMTDGRLQVLALFDKPDPLEGPFFEETIYVTPSRLTTSFQARVAGTIQHAATVLGLRHGPLHAECRVTSSGAIYVLEAAARPIGGLCSRVLSFEEAVDGGHAPRGSLEHVLLRHALGEPVDRVRRETAGAAVMMVPIPRRGMLRGVSGEEAAREVDGVTEIRITAKLGQILEPLPEAGSYLGFIFARGETARDAEAAVRGAHARLHFDISKEIAVAGGRA